VEENDGYVYLFLFKNMAKFSPYHKLSKKDEQELLLDFFRSLATVNGFKEMAVIFQDLLSRSELTMLAKRLKIAKLLLRGVSYQEIMSELRVGSQTISRINIWLQEAGEGFRMIFNRTKNKEINLLKKDDGSPWTKLRRAYPMYHWPELLIKEIIATANKKQKDKLYVVLKNLQLKGKLNKDFEKYLKGVR